jgi:hypothetical protein
VFFTVQRKKEQRETQRESVIVQVSRRKQGGGVKVSGRAKEQAWKSGSGWWKEVSIGYVG